MGKQNNGAATGRGAGRFEPGPGRFVLLFTLFTLIAFNGPMFARAVGLLRDASGGDRLLTLGLLAMLVIFLQVVSLGLLSLLSIRLMKLVAILSLLVNAFAFYFIHTYGTLIDINVIRSVFATDIKTTTDLLHPKLFAYVLVLGILPALVVVRLPVRRSARWRQLALLGATTVAFFAYAFGASYQWLWFDRHMTVLGSLSLPWSYVINTARYLRQEAALNREQVLLADASDSYSPPAGQRQVVVLVIGESARAQNHSLYGYGRQTAPYTRDLGLVALPGARSCATYTLAGLACMLTHEGDAAPVSTNQEPLGSYLQRQGVEVIWRTNSSGEPPEKVADYTSMDRLRAQCSTPGCKDANSEAALLEGLGERIAAAASGRVFVVLHQGNGSHGPAYYDQYPADFARFTPVCDTVQIQRCSYEELVNAYDNTMVYTDWMLAQVIDMLRGLENTQSVMIYASDHGESLGEQGLYLHGMPNAVAPDVQRDIPILLWMSPEFAAARGVGPADIGKAGPYGLFNIFHSVLGAFGLTSPVYKAENDVFAEPAGAMAPGGATR